MYRARNSRRCRGAGRGPEGARGLHALASKSDTACALHAGRIWLGRLVREEASSPGAMMKQTKSQSTSPLRLRVADAPPQMRCDSSILQKAIDQSESLVSSCKLAPMLPHTRVSVKAGR